MNKIYKFEHLENFYNIFHIPAKTAKFSDLKHQSQILRAVKSWHYPRNTGNYSWVNFFAFLELKKIFRLFFGAI